MSHNRPPAWVARAITLWFPEFMLNIVEFMLNIVESCLDPQVLVCLAMQVHLAAPHLALPEISNLAFSLKNEHDDDIRQRVVEVACLLLVQGGGAFGHEQQDLVTKLLLRFHDKKVWGAASC
jgi:hypothetical protein